MKSLAVRDLIHPFVHTSMLFTRPALSSLGSHHLGFQIICSSVTVLVFKQQLFYLITAPTCKSSGAVYLDMPKRSLNVLITLSEKLFMFRKTHSICRYFLYFQASTGQLGIFTPQIREGFYIQQLRNRVEYIYGILCGTQSPKQLFINRLNNKETI